MSKMKTTEDLYNEELKNLHVTENEINKYGPEMTNSGNTDRENEDFKDQFSETVNNSDRKEIIPFIRKVLFKINAANVLKKIA